ncbi:MAG TPA: hypothetical protein DHW63_01275 [Hyphomonadaceae bacterium]|nr:hypothetical protein [Hyphomonadaceae bacterium]
MASVAGILSALGAFGGAMASADTRVSFASGVDYSSGDYGQAIDTEVLSVPLAARVITDHWSFRASIPYLSIKGPADVADTTEGGGGGDGGGDPGGAGSLARTGTEVGFGDLTLQATRSFRRLGGEDSGVYFDVTGRVRLPTGDEDRGLGVGATDYTVLGEFGNSGETGGVYANAGWRFLGDRTGTEREDGAQAGVGAWLRVNEGARIGASASWREASSQGNDDPASASVFWSQRLSDNLRLSINAGAGLSEASADYTGGVRLTWRSDRF